jgi:ankyrin repeat protein
MCAACCVQNGWTPLHYAASYGMAEAAAVLVAHGADKNAKDEVRSASPMPNMLHAPAGLSAATPRCCAGGQEAVALCEEPRDARRAAGGGWPQLCHLLSEVAMQRLRVLLRTLSKAAHDAKRSLSAKLAPERTSGVVDESASRFH